MTEKTKAAPGSVRKTQHGPTKPVIKESVSATKQTNRKKYIVEFAGNISSKLERTEVVLAAKGISSKLQDMAENLSKVEANDIMPLMDNFRDAFGPQASDQFSQVATAKIRELITAVQSSKSALDTEISRLETMVDGGDGSDMAMDMETPPAPDAAPEGMPPAGGEPAPMPGGAPEAGAGLPPEMAPPSGPADVGAGGFAGRPKKESAAVKGRKLNEFAGEPVVADHIEVQAGLDTLAEVSPKCFKFAHDLLTRIEDLAVSGETRAKLTNALAHLISLTGSAAVADDPGAMADLSFENHFIDGRMSEVARTPEIKTIVTDFHKLAHMLALAHGGHLLEDDVMPPVPAPAAPAAAPVPSASPLAAGPVFESRRRERNVKRLRESNNPDRIILTVFRNVFRECRDVGKAAIGTARAFNIDVGDVISIIREAKRVAEDAVPSLMGVEMGQPDADMNPALMGQNPTTANEPGKPRKPLTPADMRANKQMQQAQDKAAGNQPKQPITPPKQMAPVQQVQGQQQVQPVVTPQMQQQQKANMKMPAKGTASANLKTI